MVFTILQKAFAIFLAVASFFTNITAGFKQADPADEAAKRIHYGTGLCEYYDMYIPDDIPKGDVDVVLMVHGGAWIFGDQTEFSDYCSTASETFGYVAVTLDYDKVFNGLTAFDMVDEIYQAVESIKSTLQSEGYNADKMAVTGHSAGSHIALLYSYKHYSDSPIDIAFVVANSSPADFFDEDGAGTTTMEKFRYLAVSGLTGQLLLPGHEEEMKDLIAANNPTDQVTSKVPPTIVVYGAKDTMVSPTNSVNLYNKLKACGVDTTLIEYPNSDHFLREDSETMNIVRAAAFFKYAAKYFQKSGQE